MNATYYGSKLHPEQVQLGEPDKYGIKTYVEPDDPRLKENAEIEVGTVDMTPSWNKIADIIVLAFETGTDKAKEIAKAQLYHMAKVADAHVVAAKEGRIIKVFDAENDFSERGIEEG
jgi:hypothetical protein